MEYVTNVAEKCLKIRPHISNSMDVCGIIAMLGYCTQITTIPIIKSYRLLLTEVSSPSV